MTRREAAIVTAHTGHLVGYLDDFYEYVEELYGRKIGTVEMTHLIDDIIRKSEKDFNKLRVNRSK